MNCKGCATARDLAKYEETKQCVIINNSPERNCPCQECLVKAICVLHCEKFKKLFFMIFGIEPSYDYKCINHEQPMFKPYYKIL